MKRIRLKARVVPQPCIYLHICQGACDWCKTHMYIEACVGMLQHQCDCLRKNWVTAERDKLLLQKEVEQTRGTLYTLEEIAEAICHSTPCNDECPGWKYHCRKGNTGTLRWLREVMSK